MSQKAIREFDGKRLLANFFNDTVKDKQFNLDTRFAQVGPDTIIGDLAHHHPWLKDTKLVAKPDQLIKRRGKLGLVKLNASWEDAQSWISERRGKEIKVEVVTGVLETFIIEPMCPHDQTDEYYISISSIRGGDQVYFYHEGGVDIGDVDAKAEKLVVPVTTLLSKEDVLTKLISKVPAARQQLLAGFIEKLFEFYRTYSFSLLEINPLVVVNDKIFVLDLAAKVDQTADFEVGEKLWGNLDYPAPFGRGQTPEESYIASLDAKTGASLKLTVLNAEGRIWTMVAGGGASVVYADTISDLGFGKELSNYGEYSGDPNESLTYEYAKTVLDLMTRTTHPDGKILIIGGGIANFTNVAETFKGIIRALTQFKEKLTTQKVKIYVRRGGPNYQTGLQMMSQCGENTGIHIEVFGPETHVTSVASYALGKKTLQQMQDEANFKKEKVAMVNSIGSPAPSPLPSPAPHQKTASLGNENKNILFHKETTSFIYGLQQKACQNMLDFDHVCGRKRPSVTAMIYPFSGNHFQKFYWGTTEVLIPVYAKMAEAMAKHPEVEVMINFASFRSVYSSVMETLEFPQIRTIAIIAEGVPENRTKSIIAKAQEKKVNLIGPATVGGIKPGCFRIGNTGGMIDNIVASKLYRAGSVAYVSRSGGMSNELNNIISRNSDGVYEGVAIGGDRYPGSVFLDHLLRYEADPDAKMLVLLGEVGGVEEYEICRYSR